ncbi:MAG: hypothetical protein RL375_31 [Pseudomonadota bacterium]
MTASQLLAWICAAITLQLVVGGAVALWRRRTQVGTATAATPAAAAAPSAPGAWAGWREFKVARRVMEDAARTQCSFHLVPVDGQPLAPFKPGQFLTFSLDVPDGPTSGGATPTRRITRCYSLSDAPDPSAYRVTIKRVPAPSDRADVPPGLSSNHFHDQVHEGDVLRLKPPSGHFHIDTTSMVPAVLVAGGIGITPMMSMLRWCLAAQPGRRVHLVYGVRSSHDQAFKIALAALASLHPALTLHVVYSRPEPGDQPQRDYHHVGRIDIDLLRRTLPHGRHQFYICGPAPMMQSLVPALRDWGVQDSDLHYEAFGPASVKPANSPSQAHQANQADQAGQQDDTVAAPVEVRFERSGRTLNWDGQEGNLLDFAERHGLAVESGCRSGGCGACQTRLVSGTVAYADTPDHDIAPGHCLLCVGEPTSALVLEA